MEHVARGSRMCGINIWRRQHAGVVCRPVRDDGVRRCRAREEESSRRPLSTATFHQQSSNGNSCDFFTSPSILQNVIKPPSPAIPRVQHQQHPIDGLPDQRALSPEIKTEYRYINRYKPLCGRLQRYALSVCANTMQGMAGMDI